MKLTHWFHPTDTPERIGVYQRIRWNEDDPFFSYWDGRRWWPSGVTADEAFARYAAYLPYGVPRWVSQVLQWRGRLETHA